MNGINISGAQVTGVKADLVSGVMKLTLSFSVAEDTMEIARRLQHLALAEVPVVVNVSRLQPPLPGIDGVKATPEAIDEIARVIRGEGNGRLRVDGDGVFRAGPGEAGAEAA